MTADLVQFLRARLDEDERGAYAAMWADEESGNWHAYDRGPRKSPLGIRWVVIDAASEGVVDVQPQAAEDHGVARHIARHDPARVLAEVDAKRRLVDDMAAVIGGDWIDAGESELAERVLLLLALPYADHPDYREEWRP